MLTELRITIPGAPFAQPRHKARIQRTRDGRQFVQTYEPAEARSWKGGAQVFMQRAMEAAGVAEGRIAFPAGALGLHVLAIYPFPSSKALKTRVRPRELKDSAHGGDWDNVGKAIGDAGNGLLWTDDGQIAVGTVARWVAAQDEAPRVEISVRLLAAPLVQTSARPTSGNLFEAVARRA